MALKTPKINKMRKPLTTEELAIGIIVERLTDSDEKKLQNAMPDECLSCDDNGPDDFERWLENITLDELVKIIA